MKPKNIQHILNFEKVIPYFNSHIDCGLELSQTTLDKINFNDGTFYTILPNNALTGRLYDFSYGGIIPGMPSNQSFTDESNGEFTPQVIPTITKDISEFVFHFLNEDSQNCAILEHVIARAEDPKNLVNGVKTLFFKNEVYYLLNNTNTIDEIELMIKTTSQPWHFLLVLTNLEVKSLNLSKKDLKMICVNATHIIIGAYDEESYIFWQRDKTI